jgi:hypothetical protein
MNTTRMKMTRRAAAANRERPPYLMTPFQEGSMLSSLVVSERSVICYSLYKLFIVPQELCSVATVAGSTSTSNIIV